jgi:hypothetical protein
MGKHNFLEIKWTVEHKHGDKVLWKETKRNALVDQGERLVLETFFQAVNSPTNFFVGMAYGSMSEASTLDTIPGEPVGAGYSRITLTRDTIGFPEMAQVEGDWVVYTADKYFEASGGSIGPVNLMWIGANIGDGTQRLVSYFSLPIETTLEDGETLTFTVQIKAM